MYSCSLRHLVWPNNKLLLLFIYFFVVFFIVMTCKYVIPKEKSKMLLLRHMIKVKLTVGGKKNLNHVDGMLGADLTVNLYQSQTNHS